MWIESPKAAGIVIPPLRESKSVGAGTRKQEYPRAHTRAHFFFHLFLGQEPFLFQQGHCLYRSSAADGRSQVAPPHTLAGNLPPRVTEFNSRRLLRSIPPQVVGVVL